MKRRNALQLITSLMSLETFSLAHAQNTASATLLQSSASQAQWQSPTVRGGGWLEWRLNAPDSWAAISNPFDAQQLDMWVQFSGPSGQSLRATAFWARDSKAKGWVVRLTPNATGLWRGQAMARIGNGEPFAVGAPLEVAVDKVIARQRIAIDPQNPGYFAYEDGQGFIPVGLNIAWGEASPIDDYKRWFRKLAQNGGNFARIWMASWSFGLEWKDTGLGQYHGRMDRAYQLDSILELAEQYGIKIMLCLLNHGAYSTQADSEWATNPYNAANGGPLRNPEEFVTHPEARALFARRLRYIAARWSHSPALHSWEWWNEITWTPIRAKELAPWIREMNAVLTQHDPYQRLRSTSWADRGEASIWAMPEIDFAQQHDYVTRDLNLHYAGQYKDFRADVPSKPLLPAELGMDAQFKADTTPPYNWEGVHLHNGLWAPLFRGYASTALYWWWELLVDPTNLWSHYKGISTFVKAVQDSGRSWATHRPHPVRLKGGEATALALKSSNSMLLWVRADLQDAENLKALYAEEGAPAGKWNPTWKPLPQCIVRCTEAPHGAAQVQWMDCQTGQWLDANQTVQSKDDVLELQCPSFSRDIAAFVTWA